MTDSKAPYARPDVRAFLAFLNGLPGPKTHELEPAAARQAMAVLGDVGDPPVGDLAVIRDLSIPGPAGVMAARLFDSRAERGPGPLLLYFHGGGFVLGDIDSHASLTAEMARQLDLPVLSVDYRLAPEAKWPAAPDDCEAAARWVATNPHELGREVTGLVLSGDSAGGTLAIVTAMSLRDKAAAVPVVAQAPLYPAVDLEGEYPSAAEFPGGFLLTEDGMDWFKEHYAPDHADYRGAPLVGEMAGLPPAVVVTASLDPIRDQGRAYAAALISAGVPVVFQEAKGHIHGFANLRKAVPSGIADLAHYLAALKAIIERSAH